MKDGTFIGIQVFNERRSVCYSYSLWSLFLFAEDAIAFRTSRLADAIASDDMLAESDPFGSGRLSFGLKYRRIDISAKVYTCATRRATIAIILVL